MTELIFTAGFALVAAVLLCACSDKLDIQQVYEFDLATLPVQSTIVEGGEAEIRCQLVRSGRYEETEYFIRYFQPTGKGELRLEDGTVLLPNDLCPMTFIRCRARPSGSITGRSAPTSRRLTSTLWIRLTRR